MTTAAVCPVCEMSGQGCHVNRDGSAVCRVCQASTGDWRAICATADGGTLFELVNGAPAASDSGQHRPDPQSDAEPEPARPVLVFASDVKLQAVEWVWANRIEQAALNLVAGKQGGGKGAFLAALASHITTGLPWPDDRLTYREPGGVVLLTGEEHLGKTTFPRLKAACADLTRVAVLRQVQVDGRRRRLNLLTDLDALREALDRLAERVEPQAILIDPIGSYVSGKVDSNSNEDVRYVLDPLVELAEDRDVAVVVVKHPNKPSKDKLGADALYRVAGSSAWTEVPRAVHLFCRNPEDKTQLLFAPLKLNNGPMGNAVGCRIRSETVEGAGSVPLLVWDAEPVEVESDSLLDAPGGRKAAATDRASAVLTLLRDNGGTVTAEQVAEVLGLSERGATRWLNKVGAQPRKDGGGPWLWDLSVEGDMSTLSTLTTLTTSRGELDELDKVDELDKGSDDA